MIPVLDGEQMRAADGYTIDHAPIASIDLMELAANQCVAWIMSNEARLLDRTSGKPRYSIVCGTGNNGGDGLAIARLLADQGREVRVLVVGDTFGSDDFRTNYQRWQGQADGAGAITVRATADLPQMETGTIAVDALFGTGLNRPLRGLVSDVVQWINRSEGPVVSIDIPSGLLADGTVLDPAGTVRADHTLTFHCPKPAFFYRECSSFVGQWHLLSIGLDDAFISGLNSRLQLIETTDAQVLLPRYQRFAHKGDHGHALLIAGSEGMMGAAVLAVCAALRSGAGLVTARVPGTGISVVQSSAPEAICSKDPGHSHVTALPHLSKFSAIGMGPGLGREASHVVKQLIQDVTVPLLLDADALNALAENKTWLAYLPKGTVLTPHPKEFDRLFGGSITARERVAVAREEAVKRGIVIVLKGANTAICEPNGTVYFNPTGDPGMAKGGSGDVLTGVITGLLARGLSPLHAALLGTYLHGSAGSLTAKHVGRDGMTAMDIVHHLPMAWRALRKDRSEDTVQ
ncbi:MAG: NAD(P)H-hydrate dehydratase [Flavobacteriales bacterium]